MYRIQRCPYPNEVKALKDGARNLQAFSITSPDDSIGVMYAEEPLDESGKLFKHVSISYCTAKGPTYPCSVVRSRVALALQKLGLEYPKNYTIETFSAGFFAGKGIHIWED